MLKYLFLSLETTIGTLIVVIVQIIVEILAVEIVIIRLGLLVLAIVQAVPDIRQANGRVEPIEDGNWRAERVDYAPLENTEMFDEIRLGVESFRRERVEEPHGHVGEQQSGDELPCRLAHERRVGRCVASETLENEQRLKRALNDRQDGCDCC